MLVWTEMDVNHSPEIVLGPGVNNITFAKRNISNVFAFKSNNIILKQAPFDDVISTAAILMTSCRPPEEKVCGEHCSGSNAKVVGLNPTQVIDFFDKTLEFTEYTVLYTHRFKGFNKLYSWYY